VRNPLTRREIKFDSRARRLRKRLGLTQPEMAASLAVSLNTVKTWESRRSPRVPTGRRLEDFLALEQDTSRANRQRAGIREPSNQQIFDAVMNLIDEVRMERESRPAPAEEPSPRENARTGD